MAGNDKDCTVCNLPICSQSVNPGYKYEQDEEVVESEGQAREVGKTKVQDYFCH